MTDEKLVAELRHPTQRNEYYYEPLCARAADEIESLARDLRLAESARDYANDVLAYAKEQLAQSDAEGKLLPGLRRAAYILVNEIKRIEANPASLAQSNADPVAWRDALLKVRATIEQTKENLCNTKISSSSAPCSTPQSNRF